ncbi:DTD1 [Symbiodinium natans]|uniref:D-aminoacyl-tRNA deacylase n=1 Tax=Symbiodinium natans TaxID=878477 RepID=A0A812HWP2_9DINO|nr:DTD1 [Symbiodinium natans]
MKLVIQRVARATVTVENSDAGTIGPGLLWRFAVAPISIHCASLVILLGIVSGDTVELAQRLATKALKLRLWPDVRDASSSSRSWATSVLDNGYAVLVVSQFTLFATFKGTKPNFNRAMGASEAQPIYEAFVATCAKELGDDRVKTGEFGADMKVDLCNDGPVTVELAGTARSARRCTKRSRPSGHFCGLSARRIGQSLLILSATRLLWRYSSEMGAPAQQALRPAWPLLSGAAAYRSRSLSRRPYSYPSFRVQ